MSDSDKEDVYRELLHVLLARMGQLKVKSPGEAEKFLLSTVSDANPVKELLVLQSQGADYQSIEEHLRRKLEADIEGADP
ncbi:MAG: hypothetical protein ACOC6F_04320 [bacterium]